VEEVSKILKISPSTVYYLTRQRKIPYIKIGKHIRFIREHIEEYLKKESRKNGERAENIN